MLLMLSCAAFKQREEKKWLSKRNEMKEVRGEGRGEREEKGEEEDDGEKRE